MAAQRRPRREVSDRPRAGIGAWATGATLALQLLVPVASGAATDADVAQRAASPRRAEFCPIGGCRPAAGAAWSTVAFGTAVLATVWTARREDPER